MCKVIFKDGTEEIMKFELLQRKLKDQVAKSKIKTWSFK